MNISGFYQDSITNGVGLRSVLFVSGCPHHCSGCHNKETWNEEYGEPFKADYYYQKITSNKLISGVTVSGGEPLTEAHIIELIPFLERIKQNTNLNIWCYTGFTLEELLSRNDFYTNHILELIDVLVDGPFIEELKDGLIPFKGSNNQRIIDLKESKVWREYNQSIYFQDKMLLKDTK